MKVFEQPSYRTLCGTPEEWKTLKSEFQPEDKVSVLDLRTALEESESKLDTVPDNWLYRRLPVRGETVSEQDVDVFRREQRRHGKLIVVAPNESRATLLILTDLARINRSLLSEEETSGLQGIESEKGLLKWLNSYLERHQTTEPGGLE